MYEIHRNRHISVTQMQRQSSITNLDLKYSLDKIGDGSVYKFFLGKRVLGWLIAISTIGAQIWMLSIFVEGSKRDTSDGKVDMSYTWKCTRDKDECFDTNDLDWRGWIAFAILMASHLLTDAINGMKMIKHSTKQRHGRNARIRLFVGGTLLTFVTVFTTYVSTLYNQVIATSKLFLSNDCQINPCLLPCGHLLIVFLSSSTGNTEIITNSVIILFICDVDELLYSVLTASSSRFKSMLQEDETESDSNFLSQGDDLKVVQQPLASLCGVKPIWKAQWQVLQRRFECSSRK